MAGGEWKRTPRVDRHPANPARQKAIAHPPDRQLTSHAILWHQQLRSLFIRQMGQHAKTGGEIALMGVITNVF